MHAGRYSIYTRVGRRYYTYTILRTNRRCSKLKQNRMYDVYNDILYYNMDRVISAVLISDRRWRCSVGVAEDE